RRSDRPGKCDMAASVANNPLFVKLHQNRGLLFPCALIALLVVILVPLPQFVLDLLLVLNITLSVIVLVTTVYVQSPLEFAVFPSLLLAVTLFRLVLNIATTRLILTASGDPTRALHAAGEVINTFAEFVTTGSGRISEVAARFTLDAMPGKQMAIDADLNAGLITEPQARERRDAISRE